MVASTPAVTRLILLTVVLSACLAACSSKPREKAWQFWRPKKEAPAPTVYGTEDIYGEPPEPVPGMGSGDIAALEPIGPGGTMDGTVIGEGEGIPPTEQMRQEPLGTIPALPTIYFPFDSDVLRPSEKEVLDKSAEWLKGRPSAKVQIEGHCDERGTPEYNLHLGQRRADKVREYLASKGVAPDRVMTISYGEERPIDGGHSEQSYAMNRRAQFLVLVIQEE